MANIRVEEVKKINQTLPSQYIKHASGKYITVEDYLTNYYPDNLPFDVYSMIDKLNRRVEDAKKHYEFERLSIYNADLSDSKYTQPVVRTKDGYMSFIDYLNGFPVGSVTSEGLVINGETKSFDDLYNVFYKNIENAAERAELETIDTPEPTEEEQEIAYKQYLLGGLVKKIAEQLGKNVNDAERASVFGKRVYETYIVNNDKFFEQYSSGELEQSLIPEVDRSFVKKDDRTDVDKVEEMYIDNGKVITNSIDKALSTVSQEEINALLEGFEKKNTSVITLSGDEDEEEVEITEPEETAIMRAGDEEEEITEPEVTAIMQDQNIPIRGAR